MRNVIRDKKDQFLENIKIVQMSCHLWNRQDAALPKGLTTVL